MTRYILIDANSGYIWGDTADLDGPARDETPEQAARRIDESVGGRLADEHTYTLGPVNSDNGYFAYRADDAFPPVDDGQDQKTINAVEHDCAYIGFVSVKPLDPLLTPGNRVEGGEGEDFDRGYVHEIDGNRAFVGWDSGVSTWTPISTLRPFL